MISRFLHQYDDKVNMYNDDLKSTSAQVQTPIVKKI